MRLELFEIVQGAFATAALTAILFAAVFLCACARVLLRERRKRRRAAHEAVDGDAPAAA